jgi:flagellum-specific ATP synthase
MIASTTSAALTQSPRDRASTDAFSDLARHLKGKQNVDAGD